MVWVLGAAGWGLLLLSSTHGCSHRPNLLFIVGSMGCNINVTIYIPLLPSIPFKILPAIEANWIKREMVAGGFESHVVMRPSRGAEADQQQLSYLFACISFRPVCIYRILVSPWAMIDPDAQGNFHR
ncbi:hypothetical protein M426DRAFT_22447 [Hypoxylon sp. CI-4A]|nr:hypothetical protein M426DRAFT_22447 [Hypoxylon sp. CI-4A]